MNSHEAKSTLDCAVKIKIHLQKALTKKYSKSLEDKLAYVNDLIIEIKEESLITA